MIYERTYPIFKKQLNTKFPIATMWALTPGFVHARPFAQPPIDTRGNFCWEGGKTFEKYSD
jgi:hypothetical protein